MMEQLSFDFCVPAVPVFDPVAEYAKLGTGFTNGKERVKKFFSTNPSQKQKETFLKKEYGLGGFGFPCDKPFEIYRGNHDAKEHIIMYYLEDMQEQTLKISHGELSKKITELIAKGEY